MLPGAESWSAVRGRVLLAAGDLRVVSVVGAGQLIAWGILFYATPTLLAAASQETGAAQSTGFAAFTCAMLIAGFLAQRVGEWVDRRGARAAFIASSVVGALALALPAAAPGVLTLFACAGLLGAAMALGLYETAFAAIVHLKGARARPYIIGVTLYGGLASSVFWPLTVQLLRHCSARRVFVIYAGGLLLLALLYRAMLPAADAPTSSRAAAAVEPAHVSLVSRHFAFVAFAFTAVAAVTSGIGANLPALFSNYALDPWERTLVPAMVGITQTVARAGELVVGARRSAVWWGALAIGGLSCAVVLLLLGFVSTPAAWLGGIVYGACGGLLSTARASVIVALFGSADAAALFGALAARSNIPRALAPWLFASISEAGGTGVALTSFGVLAVVAACLYFMGVRLAAGSTTVTT